jgi:hypothetical protein
MEHKNQKYSHELIKTEIKSKMVFIEGYSVPIGCDDHYLLWNAEFLLGKTFSQECLRVESKGVLNRKPFDNGKFITPPPDLLEEIRKVNYSINKRYLRNSTS